MSASPWLGGQRVTAERLSEMLNKWSSWTPVWSTFTGAALPSFGNAVLDCRYTVSGDLVTARYDFQFGTTTNFGGGGINDEYTFTLPVTAASTTIIAGSGWGHNNAVANTAQITPWLVSTTKFLMECTSGNLDGTTVANGNRIDAVSPWTWVANSRLVGVLQYEKA